MRAVLTRRGFIGNCLAASAAVPLAAGVGSCAAGKPMKTITAGEGRYAGRTGAAIQRAIDDAAAAGGGTVVVPPGMYMMHDALHLRSGVHVLGQPGAVLKKVPSVQSPLLDYVGYGHYEITVRDPEKFPPGTGIHILDDDAGGFYTTVGTVVAREGETLFISRMLNHDYRPSRNARVVSVFPVVEGENISDAAVEGLTIDGSSGEETFTLNGCRGGGMFLIMCHRIVIRGVEITRYRGDALSFQQCTDIVAEKCRIHHNTGHGLHPGSGSVRYVMRDCEVHDNGGCGLFYCLRTTHSICRGNVLRDNGRSGISVGERDTDHLIEDNTIAGNGEEGIFFREPARRSGDRVIIRSNRIGPDGAKKARPEIVVPAGLRDVHVLDNRIAPASGCAAMSVAAGCADISFSGNEVAGRPQRAEDISGAAGAVTTAQPARLPPVGPAALPLDGARHLNVAALRPWEEWFRG